MSEKTVVDVVPVDEAAFALPLPFDNPRCFPFGPARGSDEMGAALDVTKEQNIIRISLNFEDWRAYPLFPVDRTIVADPIRSALIANAVAMTSAVSPAAIASLFFSSAIFFKCFSVFNRPLPLPWKACERCFQACDVPE
jgi:hypothetical protein